MSQNTGMSLSLPENQLAIRRAVLGLCHTMAWAPLNEFTLPAAGRRADIMALRPDNGFVCIEIKSGPRDFMTDHKWPDYRAWCDQFFFAVDETFPRELLPGDVGIIVAPLRALTPGVVPECAVIRASPEQKLASPRRRRLSHLFGFTAASRLASLEDPAITASLRAARRVE